MSINDTNGQSCPDVPQEKLERLLTAYGIAGSFIEFSGHVAVTPLENRLKILAALGVTVASEGQVDAMLEALEARPWRQWMEPVAVLSPGAGSIRFSCPEEVLSTSFQWRLSAEDGRCESGSFVPLECPELENRRLDGRRYSAREVFLPPLSEGYHELAVSDGTAHVTCLLIVTAGRCHEPEWLAAGRRLWGLSVQLYSVYSGSNWGMGDFGDLARLIRDGAREGADFLLLNPLHALDNRDPGQASPYSPTDRRYLHPLYIDVTAEPDFEACRAARELVAGRDFQASLARARRSEWVDYRAVFSMKYRVFDLMYEHFMAAADADRRADFEQFLYSQGGGILAFANCQAGVAIDGVRFGAEPRFHLYLQWLAYRQLQACQARAKAAGMVVGLVRDLAVGSGSDSCEVRGNPGLFSLRARIGAPPDNFNPQGQNWGLPPMRPDVLRQSRFAHFITLLRENMAACGALRIDHVMALMRLWWCPVEDTDAAGAYVHYPVEELFAIVCLESRRAGCVVIGEDLGVVPPEIRAHLDEAGLLSNVIFYFEKYDGRHFKKPRDYPSRALAMVANHDVPPLKAWWNMDDLRLRRDLGLIDSDSQLENDIEYRIHEKRQLLDLLAELHMLPPQWAGRDIDSPFDINLGSAILRCCGATRAVLVSVQLDDVAGADTPVNIPGTSTQYPNWQRKIPISLETLFSTQDTRQLLDGLRQERS